MFDWDAAIKEIANSISFATTSFMSGELDSHGYWDKLNVANSALYVLVHANDPHSAEV